MNDLSRQFSLYEILRILIPGALITTNVGIACDVLHYSGLTISNSYYSGIIFFLSSFIAGLLVYSFDLPKRLSFFQKDLPTNKIEQKHTNLDKVRIANSYFSFYDTLSAELKSKTEVYSGFFHFGINLAFSSLLCFVTELIINASQLFGLILLDAIFFIVTVIISVVIYHSRLKFAFKRHLGAYFASPQYQDLLRPKHCMLYHIALMNIDSKL